MSIKEKERGQSSRGVNEEMRKQVTREEIEETTKILEEYEKKKKPTAATGSSK